MILLRVVDNRIQMSLSKACPLAVDAKNNSLSHNNPCFQCNIAITNFLVSNTLEIRFHDVIGQGTVRMYFVFYTGECRHIKRVFPEHGSNQVHC